MVDISAKYRDTIHEYVLSQRFRSGDRLAVYSHMNIWFQAVLSVLANDESYLDGYEIVFEECTYLRNTIGDWIMAGLDLYTEIDKAGWRDRENAEKWWCEI